MDILRKTTTGQAREKIVEWIRRRSGDRGNWTWQVVRIWYKTELGGYQTSQSVEK